MSPRKTMLVAAAAAMLWGTKAFSAILATDANAMAGFHGTQDFSNTISTLTMKGEVDYAVYEPGKFKLSFGSGSDPSNDKRYVYAYQIRNTGGTADRDLGFLSVGIDQNSPAKFDATDIGIIAVGDHGDDPSLIQFVPGSPPINSATWNFANTIPDGHTSEILLFTSFYPPAFYDSSLQAGALSKQSKLPSPIPEPGTALTACGMGMALLVRRRKQK